MRILVGLVSIACLGACGDDGGKGAGDDAPDDAAGDGQASDGAIDSPPIDAMIDAPAGATPLKVKNYLAWCSVSVNGAAASTASVQNVNVAPGEITLIATGIGDPPMFIVAGNMWHHTDGDTGSGEPGTIQGTMDPSKSSTAKVTVGAAAKCVWVCCPFPNGTGCNVADQCP